MVTCNVTANASNIRKSLESLQVRPVIVPAEDSPWVVEYESVIDTAPETDTPRQFVLVANLTSAANSTCFYAEVTLNATTLGGRLIETIDTQLPLKRFSVMEQCDPGLGNASELHLA